MVFFYTNFSFRSHVSAACRSYRYRIRDLRLIRRYLTFDSANVLGHALVSSRLGYWNSLLLGIADKEIIQLQRTPNSLVCVVTKKAPLTRSVPLLRSQNLLPIKFRIECKTCRLTNNTFSENQPDYLNAMLTPSTPPRSLRSNNGINFSVSEVKTNTGAGAFLLLRPHSVEQAPSLCLLSSFNDIFQETSEDTSF